MNDTTNLILAAIADLKADMRSETGGINTRLDTLNGRTRKVEQGLAVHKILWLLLGTAVSILVPVILSEVFK